ncbi:hypothetical protein QJQ45_008273 [Haematococcus lacustris]|nr:hypothetical protein QJQ45_008273 [Haematococcus lacustris]
MWCPWVDQATPRNLGRWVDRGCNSALDLRRAGEDPWRPVELCWWPHQARAPALGKEYPGLGFKKLRDQAPNAQAQQPVAQWEVDTPSLQVEGYVSRAAYKLKEVQQKHHVIKPGGRVLDLGCSPGAWLQVACQELGPPDRGGLVLGEVEVPSRFCDARVQVLQADARTLSPDLLTSYAPQGFDTVLSDMLHFTR